MTQEDPGWWPSLRGLWRHWIALVGSVMRLRARPVETNGLILLRSVFLVLVAALLLFVVALSFIAPWDGGDEGWVPWAVVVIGIASLAYVARIRRRPLPTTSPEALARYYRALFFIGVGVASAAALWGFVGVFQGGSAWIYLVGLAFGLVGLWMIAPTRSDIGRRQREITLAGSPLSLVDALISVPWP
jgi:O-antigen/teichoic acid export membrane protein